MQPQNHFGAMDLTADLLPGDLDKFREESDIPGLKPIDPFEGYKLQEVDIKPDPDAEDDLKTDVKHDTSYRTIILDSMSAPYFRYPKRGNSHRFLFVNDATILDQKSGGSKGEGGSETSEGTTEAG